MFAANTRLPRSLKIYDKEIENLLTFSRNFQISLTSQNRIKFLKSLIYAAQSPFYIFTGSDERKNRFSKNEYFGCKQKKYIHRDYSIRSFKKIRCFSAFFKLSPSSRSFLSCLFTNYDFSSRVFIRRGRSIRVFSRLIKLKKESF